MGIAREIGRRRSGPTGRWILLAHETYALSGEIIPHKLPSSSAAENILPS